MIKKIICGVLCFNNEKTIHKVIKDLNKIKSKIDFIFIDDCSSDKTLKILKKANKKIISHKKNLGYGAAVKSSFKYANNNKYDFLIIFPGDNQRSIKDLLRLINHQKNFDYDLVSGSKFKTQNKLFITRKFGNILFSKFAKFFWNSNFKDNLSGFKIYKIKTFRKIIPLLGNDYSFDICLNQIIFRKKISCAEILVDCKYNQNTTKMRSIFDLSKKNIVFIGIKMISDSIIIFLKIKFLKKF
tara:strand:- start:500 stop:1225 length:726 start_codon:yes stop_codon:yes gene_type:complete